MPIHFSKKRKKTPQKFQEIAMAFRKKILEKKMNGSETDRFTLGAIRDAS